MKDAFVRNDMLLQAEGAIYSTFINPYPANVDYSVN
jgi:hypothetical protein